jgi:hypothetical protein
MRPATSLAVYYASRGIAPSRTCKHLAFPQVKAGIPSVISRRSNRGPAWVHHRGPWPLLGRFGLARYLAPRSAADHFPPALGTAMPCPQPARDAHHGERHFAGAPASADGDADPCHACRDLQRCIGHLKFAAYSPCLARGGQLMWPTGQSSATRTRRLAQWVGPAHLSLEARLSTALGQWS